MPQLSRDALVLLAVATLVATAAQPSATTQVPPQEHLAVTDITVIDVDNGRLLPNQTVVVANGRITSVGSSRNSRVPGDARQIDGHRKFLVPGLIDTHIHLANSADRDRLRAFGPLLAHGVTAVRDAGGGGQDDWLVELRSKVARGDILAPRIYVSGMVSGRSVARSGLGDAGALARQLLALGVDGLKIRDGLTRDDIRAVVDVATQAKRPVYGHTYDATSRERDEIYTLDAVQMGVSGSMHVMGMPQLGWRGRPEPPAGPRFGSEWQRWWQYYASLWLRADGTAEGVLIDTMVAHDAWLEPTLITEDWIANADVYRQSWRQRGLPGSFERAHEGFPLPAGVELQQYRDSFARMKHFVRRFHEAGGVITAGTDCVPACGYGLQDELQLLVSAGLTPAAALRAATIDAARVLGWADHAGRVAANRIADLVVLDGNPLEDIRSTGGVHAVIANGRYLDKATLGRLVADAAAGGDGR